MVDVVELRQRIDDSGYKLQHIAEQCGLTYQGFLPKLKGEREFTVRESWILKALLHLTDEDWKAIFFSQEADQ